MRIMFFVATIFVALAVQAFARETATAPVQATFLITGLHCPPCVKTVESSLQRVKGVQAAKVDWTTKNARVTFDESQVSAEEIAAAIANTPHMMGKSLHYSGSLALKVAGLKDDAAIASVKKTLADVPGVAHVWVYGSQSAVAVDFDQRAKVTSKQLIDLLSKAGFTAGEF